MATRIIFTLGGIFGLCYAAIVGFSMQEEKTIQTLKDKNYGLSHNEDTRKKMLFMSVLQNAAGGQKALYRQSKEDIEQVVQKK